MYFAENKISKTPIHFIENAKDCFLTDTFEFDFNGNGFVIWGNIAAQEILLPIISIVYLHAIGSEVFGLAEPNDPYVAKVENMD